LWFVKFTRGEYPEAIAGAERLRAAAQSAGDSGQILEAQHSTWATLSAMGRSLDALPHLERGLALYAPEQHGQQALVYGGHDAGACCRWHLALNQWFLGFPDRALDSLHDAMRLAGELRHPMTTVIALWFAAWLHFQRGEHDKLASSIEQLRSLASAHGFKAWLGSTVVLPHASSESRLADGTLAEMERALQSIAPTAWRKVFDLSLLARMYGNSGHAERGRKLLHSISASDRDACYAAEVARIEGELLLKTDGQVINEAERCFQRALQIAQSRGEKSLELRAAMSLAQLWQRQHRQEDAHRLVADIYGWFTEGFDTADLRAAKTLLTELAGTAPAAR